MYTFSQSVPSTTVPPTVQHRMLGYVLNWERTLKLEVMA